MALQKIALGFTRLPASGVSTQMASQELRAEGLKRCCWSKIHLNPILDASKRPNIGWKRWRVSVQAPSSAVLWDTAEKTVFQIEDFWASHPKTKESIWWCMWSFWWPTGTLATGLCEASNGSLLPLKRPVMFSVYVLEWKSQEKIILHRRHNRPPPRITTIYNFKFTLILHHRIKVA